MIAVHEERGKRTDLPREERPLPAFVGQRTIEVRVVHQEPASDTAHSGAGDIGGQPRETGCRERRIATSHQDEISGDDAADGGGTGADGSDEPVIRTELHQRSACGVHLLRRCRRPEVCAVEIDHRRPVDDDDRAAPCPARGQCCQHLPAQLIERRRRRRHRRGGARCRHRRADWGHHGRIGGNGRGAHQVSGRGRRGRRGGRRGGGRRGAGTSLHRGDGDRRRVGDTRGGGAPHCGDGWAAHLDRGRLCAYDCGGNTPRGEGQDEQGCAACDATTPWDRSGQRVGEAAHTQRSHVDRVEARHPR